MSGARGGRRLAAVGAATWAVLALPPVAGLLESHLLTHAGLQIPLLAIAGGALGAALPFRTCGAGGLNEGGVAGLLVGIFGGLVWMLPRSMDATLAGAAAELAKLASVPLLVGLPLGASWRRLDTLARAFVLASLVSMLLTLGWLYRAAPTRVCNYYLRSEQLGLGTFYLSVAAAVSLSCVVRCFAGNGWFGRARFLSRSRSRVVHAEPGNAACGRETLARNLE